MKRIILITMRTGVYLLVLGVVAWLTGSLFIFPSLGPTAYILAFDDQLSYSASVVIGGHGCGIVGGLISYMFIVNPVQLLHLAEPLSSIGLQLALGSVISLMITAFLMLWFQISHPPACATTLIVSLGIMPHWQDGMLILIAVTIMYAFYWLYQKRFARNFEI